MIRADTVQCRRVLKVAAKAATFEMICPHATFRAAQLAGVYAMSVRVE